MRVLLVYPPQYDPGKHRRFLEERPSETYTLPLGLATMAAVLEREGHEVGLIDACRWSWEELERHFRAFYPQVVGISCLSDQRASCFRLARAIKSWNTETKVVLGGAHATLMYDQILRHFPIDAVVLGEGEQTLLELVAAWEGGSGPGEVRGVAFLDGRQVSLTPARPLLSDLDTLPFPAYHLLEIDSYKSWGLLEAWGHKLAQGEREAYIIGSRGCPWRCSFCSTSRVWGGKWRARSARNVVDEMEWLHRQYGCRFFVFLDDIFSLDGKRVLEVCEEILRRRLKVLWAFETRVNVVSGEMLSKAAEAGCILIFYGIESGSETVLKTIRKGIGLEQTVAAFELTRAAGIHLGAFVMVGNPGETEQSVDATIHLLRLIRPDLVWPQIAMVFPGTDLYEKARAEGFIDDDYWLTSLPAPYYTYENDLRRLVRWHRKVSYFCQGHLRRLTQTLRDALEFRSGVKVTRGGICRGRVVPPIRQIQWKNEIPCTTGAGNC